MESCAVETRQPDRSSILCSIQNYHLRTISPHTTLCLCNPFLVLPVKKPSLPATSSLQSRAISFRMKPASSTCADFMPKVTHFPIRRFKSDNHRGFKDAVTASASELSEALGGAVANSRMDTALRWALLRRKGSATARRRTKCENAIGTALVTPQPGLMSASQRYLGFGSEAPKSRVELGFISATSVG